MKVRTVLEERYGFDTGTWLLLTATVAAPLAIWVPPEGSDLGFRGPCSRTRLPYAKLPVELVVGSPGSWGAHSCSNVSCTMSHG